MKRKLVSVLLCAAMITTLVSGCGNKNTSSDEGTKKAEESGGDVTISYACWDSNQAKLIQTVADEF